MLISSCERPELFNHYIQDTRLARQGIEEALVKFNLVI
jgi:hypothetical protein